MSEARCAGSKPWRELEYRPEPSLAMWVPKEMQESYRDLPGASPVFGAPSRATARYSDYRRFTVAAQDEKATLPQPAR